MIENQEQLKKKYKQLINDLTKEMSRQKKAIRNDEETKPASPDPMLKAKLEISKFQRDLLVKLHKEGEYSDDALKKSGTGDGY
jgi:CPA1 family monovalent cation:H+ antiporter